MTKKPNVGVVVGRFQVPELHAGHRDLLQLVSGQSKKMIVVVGSSHVINTRHDPLDFKSRELMLRSFIKDMTVVGIKDRNDDHIWSNDLDKIIISLINPQDTVMLYGSRDSFISHYTGQFNTTEVEPSEYTSGTAVRENLWDICLDSVKFRSGVLWAAYNRYPTIYPTVDVAIFSSDNKQILLGAKEDEATKGLWRLPGGFVDLADGTFIDAAKREVREELGAIEISDFQYVTDMKIDDWRYREQEDSKIHTILFRATHVYGTPKPGDDLYIAKWFDFNKKLLDTNIIVPAHIQLINKLLLNDRENNE